MRKKILCITLASLMLFNITGCEKTDEVKEQNNDNKQITTEISSNDTSNNSNETEETHVSMFGEYYTDPETGLEYRLLNKTEYSNYNVLNYVAKDLTYSKEISSLNSNEMYVVKEDIFDDGYFEFFVKEDCVNIKKAYDSQYHEWLKDSIEETEEYPKSIKLYKFEFDKENETIKLENKKIKIQDDEIKVDMEYTDEQLERYEGYKEQSDSEFVSNYIQNDMEHYEEDLDTIIEAYEKYVEELEKEEEARKSFRQKGEKIQDSEYCGYLLTYDEKYEYDDITITHFNVLYGYDMNTDEFAIKMTGEYRDKVKITNINMEEIVDNKYTLEQVIGMSLGTLEKTSSDTATSKESEIHALRVYEDLNTFNAIKIKNETEDISSIILLEIPCTINFITKTDSGILEENDKLLHYFMYMGYDPINDDAEILEKDKQIENYYISVYRENFKKTIVIHLKPTSELKQGDVLLKFKLGLEEELTDEKINECISSLKNLNIETVYTDYYNNLPLTLNNDIINVKNGLFKESYIENYYELTFKNTEIKIDVPVLKEFTTDTSDKKANLILTLKKPNENNDFYAPEITICINKFLKDTNGAENDKQYYDNFYEIKVNDKNCYILSRAYDENAECRIYIELDENHYINIESFRIQGLYYYDKDTYLKEIENFISLLKF